MQNMLLVAWNEGVGSCPNGIADLERARETLGLGEDDELAIVLTFGYPARETDASRHSPEEWSGRANRKPLDELVERRLDLRRQHQLAEVLAGLHPLVRGLGLGERADAVDHGCQSPSLTIRSIAKKSCGEPMVVLRMDFQLR